MAGLSWNYLDWNSRHELYEKGNRDALKNGELLFSHARY